MGRPRDVGILKNILPLIAGICLAVAAHAQGLDDAEFARLHKLLRPTDDASWREIPWRISLLDAQRQAVDENKPIFIWAMDGHPLGCT